LNTTFSLIWPDQPLKDLIVLIGADHRCLFSPASLKHPHLLKLIDCCESAHRICVILESLLAANFLIIGWRDADCLARKPFPFSGIIEGLKYLHRHGIFHRVRA
jgi:hypothetical protein